MKENTMKWITGVGVFFATLILFYILMLLVIVFVSWSFDLTPVNYPPGMEPRELWGRIW